MYFDSICSVSCSRVEHNIVIVISIASKINLVVLHSQSTIEGFTSINRLVSALVYDIRVVCLALCGLLGLISGVQSGLSRLCNSLNEG